MNITVDASGLTNFLTDFEQRQVPYAMANTLNDVAKLFQYNEQQHIHGIFTVRRQDWVDRSVKITHFATKATPTTTVAISPPGGSAKAGILGKFETDSVKRPFAGGSSIAIPVEAKRNKADIIPQNARPRSFNFRPVGGAALARNASHVSSRSLKNGILRGGLTVMEGDRGTVLIKSASGQGVILQRVGRGNSGLRVLYLLKPQVHITPNLEFITHALEAATHTKDFFIARFNEAMSTAR